MEKEIKTSRPAALWALFWNMLYISAFTFGGGFVIITFMKSRFVDKYHWINEQEMLDLTALAQSSPGAIAVNAAILVGWRVGGFLGMLLAVIGTILPPLALLSVISFFYAAFAANPYVAMALRGMQAGVAAVILNVTLELGAGVLQERNWLHILIALAAFAAVFFGKINVIFVLLAAMAVGMAELLWQRRKGRRQS